MAAAWNGQVAAASAGALSPIDSSSSVSDDGSSSVKDGVVDCMPIESVEDMDTEAYATVETADLEGDSLADLINTNYGTSLESLDSQDVAAEPYASAQVDPPPPQPAVSMEVLRSRAEFFAGMPPGCLDDCKAPSRKHWQPFLWSIFGDEMANKGSQARPIKILPLFEGLGAESFFFMDPIAFSII